MKSTIDNMLIYHCGRGSQKTVKRVYKEWRNQQNPISFLHCDIPECKFSDNPLSWNGKDFNLILDHKNGVSGDNRPNNLQLLCPICNSQQKTNGGSNKGRTIQYKGGSR